MMPDEREASSLHRRRVDWIVVGALTLGESAGALLPEGWTIWAFSPVFVGGLVLLCVRHLLWPTPTIFSIAARLVSCHFAQQGRKFAWAVALGTRVGVLVVGLLAVTIVGYTLSPGEPRIHRNEALNLPARFDAGWYLGIARRGYDWSPELHGHRHPLAFFPAYPAMMRIAGELVTIPAKALRVPGFLGNGDTRVLWGGVLLSIFCFGAALATVYRLAERDGGSPSQARRTVTLLAFYPFALFFGVPYSESMFLLGASLTVLAWTERRDRAAFFIGAATGLVRSNGWTLSIALAVDAWVNRRQGAIVPRLIVAAGPLVGACLFSAYVGWVTGSPLEWANAQQGWGAANPSWMFVDRRVEAIGAGGLMSYIQNDPVDAITLGCIVLGLIAAGAHAKKGRWLYAVLIAAYLAPALAIDLPATGRMTAVLFPTFMWLAASVRGPAFVVAVILFAAGQIFLASRFFLWQPPF